MLKKARARAAEQDAAQGGADETGTRSSSRAEPGSGSVRDSSRQIWLAGLGAFARAQAEGRKVFDALVKQGESVEARTRRAATETAQAARDAAQASAKEMQKMAGGTWDRLEKVFEDRVARALSRLGVHTQADVDRLSARVDALADAVNELVKAGSGTRPAKRRAPRRGVKATGGAAAKKVQRSGKRGSKESG